MARIRTIKPDFWQDEKLAPLDPLTRLVFLGLISQADDAGRLVDNVKLIDGLLFPETNDTSRDALDTLARLGRIVRYTSESGQKLIQIVNWEKHQKVDRPGKNVLPPPPPEVLDSHTNTEPSRYTRETLATPSRDNRDRTLDLGSRTLDDGPGTKERDQDQEAEEASGPTPTHAREESPPPAAAADVDQDQPDHSEHVQAMRRLVEEVAHELPTKAERRRLRAELELIVTGDDVTAWRDARGEPVPWPDRPRLLKLALQRWKLDRDQYPKPRSALLYVVAQQYDPLPTASITRQAEAEHYAKHRDGAARRIAADPTPVGGLVGIDPPRRETERPEDRRAQEWAREHPEQFQEFIREIAEAESLQLDNTLHRIRATGLALQRVREEVLAS